LTEEKYRCGDCGKELTANEKLCSNCGSSRRVTPVFAYGTITVRTQLGLKVKEQATRKIDKKFTARRKLSEHGKEAKEELTIDIAGNRKIHHVEEQGENGQWITVHDEDVPLKKGKSSDK
jgi:uncharacterized OB-fold protein